MDPAWEAPEGVPVDAIIFGGRRPKGKQHVDAAFVGEVQAPTFLSFTLTAAI